MLKLSLHIAARTLLILRRTALVIFLLIGLIVAGLILVLRHSVLPEIELYHTDITRKVGLAVGHIVEIGRIEADWYGMNPHVRLSDIRMLDKQKKVVLALQKVDVVVSWKTLLVAELRLASLEIDRPDLFIKRDINGKLKISGVQIDEGASDNNFANLLLNQSRIVVRNARISWLDEQQSAPLLVFEKVNLVLENGWDHHRIAMRAIPPRALSTQLDVRGDLYGKSVDELNNWSGELFTQLDYADLAAWKPWLPVPSALKQGQGALRTWLEIKEGKISRVTSDLALANVQTRLAENLAPLNLRRLSGRLGWRDVGQGFEIFTRNFSLELFNNFVLKPTDTLVRLKGSQNPDESSGEFRANLLDLEGLGKLIDYLPLEREFKQRLAEFSPEGIVSGVQAKWQIAGDKKLHYTIQGRFNDLSLKRVGQFPGFSGLSGEVDGSESSGNLSLNSTRFKFDAPHYMPQPLAFDAMAVQSSWKTNPTGLEITVRNATLSNDDIEGRAYGSFQALAGSPGKLDLSVHLSRATVHNAAKYIPLVALSTDVQTWLNQALLAGSSSDVNLRLKGDLNDFPFVGNKKGIFKVNARAKGVTLAYAPEWPKIEDATTELLISGKEMSVNTLSAKSAGVSIKNVYVTIPDLLANEVLINLRGEAEGELARILEYIHVSPVRGYLDGFTDDIVSKGNGKLNLKLAIPLSGTQAVKVAGSYRFMDAEADFGKNLPTARKVTGDLFFTESGVSANNIVGNVLGGPVRVVIESAESGDLNVKLKGRANLDILRETNSHPLLRRLSGEPEWSVNIGVKDKQTRISLSSNLQGMQSSLPEPLAKHAESVMPLSVEMKSLSPVQNFTTVQYGTLLNAKLLSQKDEKGAWRVTRGGVRFAGVAEKPEKDGLWFSGTLPQLSLEGWGGLTDPEGGPSPVTIGGGDLWVKKISGFGNHLNDVHIKSNHHKGVLNAQITGKEINGDLSWRLVGLTPDDDETDTATVAATQASADDNGRLLVRLKNLDLEKLGDDGVSDTSPDNNLATALASYMDLPVIDVNVDKLSLKGRQLGRLEMLAQQHDKNFQLDFLRLSNPDGVLSLDGMLKMTEASAQTMINLKMEINNAGGMLARSGYPDMLKNGKGKLEGVLAWPGTPEMLSNASLNGKLMLNISKGQFLQIDPGIGKLLSILSLQALPKRITLDFNDVFSKGFEFDDIAGASDIKKGVMYADNFKIEGSSAKVSMKGQVDLNTETQNLRVRIVPAVGNSAALLTFAAVANPVVGAGVFIGSKILGDPLGQLLAFEYNITGNWVDPKVDKAK
jgi:uncharacterized protein (TIGR02099 family)